MSLAKSAQRVQDALKSKEIDLKVLTLPGSTRTAADAAETIGCTVAQIVKSLVFQGKESMAPYLILASGVNQVSEKQLASYLGEKIKKPDADFVREVTGYAIGGIPPIGHISAIKTLIDEDLLMHTSLWAAAGTPNTVFELPSDMLVALTGGEILPVKKTA